MHILDGNYLECSFLKFNHLAKGPVLIIGGGPSICQPFLQLNPKKETLVIQATETVFKLPLQWSDAFIQS